MKLKDLGMDNLEYQSTEKNPFIDRVDVELKRAQRYQIFISLLVYDLSFLQNLEIKNYDQLHKDILELVVQKIRAIDDVTLLDSSKIAFLLPETNRQGAEIASRRISSVLKEYFSEGNSKEIEDIITPEMASYPDAAGTKSIKDFLMDYNSMIQ